MQQFIAPRILEVNGGPSPCECREGVVCAYCVQANLILWERKDHPEQAARERILKVVAKNGPRKTARLLGIQPSTVSRWLKRGDIPEAYLSEIQKNFEIAA